MTKAAQIKKIIDRAAKTRQLKTDNGKSGEKLVLKKLKKQKSKSTTVKIISGDDPDAGYDIFVKTKSGVRELHEVKSSQRQNFTPSTWHISAKQYALATSIKYKYFFWFINNIIREPTFKKCLPKDLEFKPSRYEISLKPNHEPNKRLVLDATELVKKIKNGLGGQSRTKKIDLAREYEQIKLAVYTRSFLYQKLKKETKYKKLEVNLKQATANKPFHLKYIDQNKQEVRVDLKVTRSYNEKDPIRFYITSKQLDITKKLNSTSGFRREFWHCHLDKETSQLHIKIFNINGNEFFNQVDEKVDYYSFKPKEIST
jgi:Domain of unknown function (DUF3883)